MVNVLLDCSCGNVAAQTQLDSAVAAVRLYRPKFVCVTETLLVDQGEFQSGMFLSKDRKRLCMAFCMELKKSNMDHSIV